MVSPALPRHTHARPSLLASDQSPQAPGTQTERKLPVIPVPLRPFGVVACRAAAQPPVGAVDPLLDISTLPQPTAPDYRAALISRGVQMAISYSALAPQARRQTLMDARNSAGFLNVSTGPDRTRDIDLRKMQFFALHNFTNASDGRTLAIDLSFRLTCLKLANTGSDPNLAKVQLLQELEMQALKTHLKSLRTQVPADLTQPFADPARAPAAPTRRSSLETVFFERYRTLLNTSVSDVYRTLQETLPGGDAAPSPGAHRPAGPP